MTDVQEVTTEGITDAELDDAASILDELNDKYEDEPGAVINILLVCLAGMMGQEGARKLSWVGDNGMELTAQYKAGRAPEEALH